jgi:hypothetical protein
MFMLNEAESVQIPFVPVTQKVVSCKAVTVLVAPVVELDQIYVVAPEAVRVVL